MGGAKSGSVAGGERGDDEGMEDGEQPRAKPLMAPRSPTKEEWEKHSVSHIPFRSWCPHCVAGRGLERRHHRGSGADQDNQPYVSLDYGYLAGDATPILVAKDRWSGMVFAMAVERKGAADPHAVIKLTEWIDALGSMKVAIRSDGEPAIKQVAAAVRDSRREGTVTTLENSPPGDHASNGIAERAVGQIAGMVRTLKSELEHNARGVLETESRTWAWIVNYAACLINLDSVGGDGKSPFERWRGRRHSLPRCVFGERVWYRVGPLTPGSKADDRMVEGRFVGFQLKTGQYIVVANGEIVAARTIRRMPAEERWKDPEKVLDVGILPWDQPGRARSECVRPGGSRDQEGPAAASVPPPPPPAGSGHSRRVYLKHSDFLEHGLSESCPGCRAVKLGVRAQGHSAACRARMEDALSRTESGKRRLEIAVDRAREVVSEKAAKRAMLHYEGASSQSGAASSGSPAGSAPSGMAVDLANDQMSKRAKFDGGGPHDGGSGGSREAHTKNGDAGQGEADGMAVDLLEAKGEKILDLTDSDWDLTRADHRQAARELARAGRPRLLRIRCDDAGDDALNFAWDLCHLQREENLGYLCELCLEGARSGPGYDLKEALEVKGEAVLVRNREGDSGGPPANRPPHQHGGDQRPSDSSHAP